METKQTELKQLDLSKSSSIINNCITKHSVILLFTIFCTVVAFAQPAPPAGKRWEKVNNMSSEFSTFETAKFQKFSRNWIGRAPGLFQEQNVTVNNNKLKITAKKLGSAVTVDGKRFTHGGGIVTSKNGLYHPQGMYFECRMRGNKTFMSSTFWLKSATTGPCDTKVFELDIQELIGKGTNKPNWKPWKATFGNYMHSSTDDQTKCQPVTHTDYPQVEMSSPGTEWHTYGAWVVNPNKVRFYLDGELVTEGRTETTFDDKLFLRFAVEVYSWNLPEEGNDGMRLPMADRTTVYEYVRSYKLENSRGRLRSASLENESQLSEENKIQVYPNPAKSNLNITGVQEGTYKATVYGINGANALKKVLNVNNEGAQLQLGNLPKGVYFLNLKSADYNKTVRFVKN